MPHLLPALTPRSMMRQPLLALLAILFISGCSSKSENHDSRLSDSELLKLNLQCREAADKFVEDSQFTGDNFAKTGKILSVKYSQTHRRCLVHFMEMPFQDADLFNGEESLLDPISGDLFALQVKDEWYQVNPPMNGQLDRSSFRKTTGSQFRDFIDQRMSEP
jgi:hypothetical protein